MSANNTAALAPQQKNESTTAKEVTEVGKSVRVTCPFDNVNAFEDAQRIANLLCQSSIVPMNFQGRSNFGNCVIALEMSRRLGMSVLAVMQGMYVVKGRPAWSAQFITSAINCSKLFTRLQFETEGEGNSLRCRAWAFERATGKKLLGTWITMEMAQKEGWSTKDGSKWRTMPDQMIRYRAAAFFGRLYCPDILMGLYAPDEVETFNSTPPAVVPISPQSVTANLSGTIGQLNALVDDREVESEQAEIFEASGQN
ncbi:recombinase RecT [Pyramidobacter sp.]|uniref:recombinase RecT n=1 Tax=Pyramidobacter sp. TaxID=1943581 RepID=UPI00332350F8